MGRENDRRNDKGDFPKKDDQRDDERYASHQILLEPGCRKDILHGQQNGTPRTENRPTRVRARFTLMRLLSSDAGTSGKGQYRVAQRPAVMGCAGPSRLRDEDATLAQVLRPPVVGLGEREFSRRPAPPVVPLQFVQNLELHAPPAVIE